MGKPRALLAALVAALMMAGCSQATDGQDNGAAEATPEPDSEPETEEAPEYEPLQAEDFELNLVVTEQNYFAVWNVAWVVQPEITGDVQLEPGSEWLVTYETTVPDAALFTGEKYSFTAQVDAEGEVSYSGEGLEVARHPINAHPDRLVLEIAAVTER